MALFSQILLLLWKHLVIMWRSKLWLIGEMLFSLLLLPYVIAVRKYAPEVNKVNAYSFQPFPVTGDSADITRQIYNSETVYKYYNCNHIHLGYSYESDPDLEILAGKIMKNIHNRYYINESERGMSIQIKNFTSLDLMMKELKRDLAEDHTAMCGKYLGGIHFTKINISLSDPALSYRFILPQRSHWDDSFWLNNDPNSEQSDLNQIPKKPPYWQSGFLSIQYAIEATFIGMHDNNIMNRTNIYFQRIPIDTTLHSSIIMFLKAMHVFWTLALFFTLLHTAKNIVLEKEAGIKTYMSVMGLNSMAFYYSHIIVGFIKSSIVMVLLTGIFSASLPYTSTFLLVLLAVLFGLAMVIMSAFTSIIFKSTQVLQFMIIIITVALGVLASKTPPISSIGLCFLASLNPMAAFKLGIAFIVGYETKMKELSWTCLFCNGAHQFTIGYSMIMLIIDCVLLSCLIFYLDSVLPTDDSPKRHPLFFLEHFGCNFHKDEIINDQTDSKVYKENMEQEPANLDEADIVVHNMSKKWDRRNLAVDNLNFKAYRGQLSVLLGHNGAGKTTTFSILTGSIKSSTGNVLICGNNIESNTRECQKKMGYCPQNNPLIGKFTVKEHLKLYAGLKSDSLNGPDGKARLEREIKEIVESVGLTPKLNIESQKLSGGQKRKLCVAIALIGNSQVVLLDEPTAGMDPEARNAIGKLLTQVKKDRTILLTTHYMEEADSLGDRIGIMVNGRLVCNGSPEFLKNKFGTGYVLSIVCAGFDSISSLTSDNMRLYNQIINRVLGVIRKHSPNAYVERAIRPPEFKVILPKADKKHFANLFEELENGKILYGIHSFGLSLNTLEQVFLKVGEIAEPEDETDGTDGPANNSTDQNMATELFGVRSQQFVNDWSSIIALWFKQVAALLWRNFLWTIRNPFRSLLPLGMAILLLMILGLFNKPAAPIMHQERSLSLDDVKENMRIPIYIQGKLNGTNFQKQFDELSETICSGCVIKLDPKKDLHDELKKKLLELPPMLAGVAIYENASTGRVDVEALFNGIAIHSPPLALNFITNGLLGNKSSIRPTIEIFDVPHNMTAEEQFAEHMSAIFRNFLIAAVIIVCTTIFGATMIVPLVEEKAGKFKHQLLLTKLHVFTYWLAIFIWNMIFYTIYCSFLAIVMLIFEWIESGTIADFILLWALYLWSYVPINAVLSFVFDKPQRAFTAILLWNQIASIIFLSMSFMLNIFGLMKVAEAMNIILYLITPGYSFGSAIFQILLIPVQHSPSESLIYKDQAITMFVSGAIFWIMLAILQSRTIATKLHKLSCQLFYRRLYQRINNQDTVDEAQEDVDVRNERERLEKNENRKYVLAVYNLTKYYGNFPAVKNLTFGVKHKECFGLLGVNGAGKTTTFDILTGVNFATSGTATVEGVNVNKAPAIGYCPQFDALPMELTGREVLTLLARLNGFSDVKTRIDRILWCIRMEENAGKKIMHYSGGQRRRISLGITLVTRSSLIMLDEPTAGIDPITRRQIWNLLQAIRQQGIAMLLTSHSMEECEELCNKIAFMNKGSLIGIGTSQHLKSRFGNSYLLTITISNPSLPVYDNLNNMVMEKFDAKPTDDSSLSTTLHWEIPKHNIAWSQLYKKAQALAEAYPKMANLPPESAQPQIVDFSITQNSLEEVFLRLAKINEATPESN